MLDRQYVPKLNDVFDKVYMYGVAVLPKAELLLWYNQSKVTKKLARDLNEAFKTRCEEYYGYSADKLPRLLVGAASQTQTYALVWEGEFGEESDKFEAWLSPLGEDSKNLENEATS
jgi:hypothetical protein